MSSRNTNQPPAAPGIGRKKVFFAKRSQFSTAQLVDFIRSPAPTTPEIWDRIIAFSAHELLLPALNALTIGFADEIPPEILHILKTAESFNAERNRAMIAEAIHVARLLNQIGIEPVALKGLAYLLSAAYPEPGMRYLGDLDLLLPAETLPTAVRHLLASQYFETTTDLLAELRAHHAAIRRPGSPYIELHHIIGLGPCRHILPASRILADATPLTIDGATFRIPSPTHLAAHLILHSQLAHPYQDRIFPPLRALLDLAQLQAHFADRIDWPAIDRMFAAAGHAATLHLHLAQASEILGLTPPFPLRLSPLRQLRLARRRILNRYRWLRFFDPIYLFFATFSRRIRLLPQLLRTPRLWPQVTRKVLFGTS